METVNIKQNEIESKFAADDLDPKTYQQAINTIFGEQVRGYRLCTGTDLYYTQGENVVRLRSDDDSGSLELTCKRRLSADSTQNRKEIDLPLAAGVQSGTARAFLALSGWEEEVRIEKLSRIFDVRIPRDGYFPIDVDLTVALYDAWRPEAYVTTEMTFSEDGRYMIPPGLRQIRRVNERRFLEIEVEKNSPLSPMEAVQFLDDSIKKLREHLVLGTPLNQSLYEMYRPAKK